jgi:hypothetical protein
MPTMLLKHDRTEPGQGAIFWKHALKMHISSNFPPKDEMERGCSSYALFF